MVRNVAIFTLILTSFFPHLWKDLANYQLLILRTYCQFSGRVWLVYDKAFREHAAAAEIVDLSTMKSSFIIFVLLGRLYMVASTVLSTTCLNLPEQLGRRLYAGRGTEVVPLS